RRAGRTASGRRVRSWSGTDRGYAALYVRPSGEHHRNAWSGNRWRAAHPGRRPGHRAAEGGRREHHPAHRARAGPPVRDQPGHRGCGTTRATAGRLPRTLEHHGLVDRDVVTQRYTVGYGATVIASAVTDDALIRRVRPLLTDLCLRTGEVVTLAVARRFNLVYTDQVEPPNMMAPNWLDKPLPLHATSRGQAFLAWLGRDGRGAILPATLPRYTDHTVTDREELERELAEVRRTGFALCDREYEEFSSGASAAVLNSRRAPTAVVTVWGPAPMNSPRRLREIGREAVETSAQIGDLVDWPRT